MTKAEAIARLIKDHPEYSGTQVASMAGCSEGYVSRIATKCGLRYGTARRQAEENRNTRVMLDEPNRKWAQQAADAAGATVDDIVNSCVTDARLDEEE